jgi:micrococcal nuclease
MVKFQMTKKIAYILFFVFCVFSVGIFLENKIKSDFKKINFSSQEKVVEVKEVTNNRERAIVKRVVDGDTVELSDGRKVRYIGVNAPEMTDKRTEILCFAQMAKAENQKLVEGKTVEIEKDVSDTDKYKQLFIYGLRSNG